MIRVKISDTSYKLLDKLRGNRTFSEAVLDVCDLIEDLTKNIPLKEKLL